MYFHFTWDQRYKKVLLNSDSLEMIRSKFSEANPAKKCKAFKHKRFIPDRLHVISSNGRFDLGLLAEVIKYIKTINAPYTVSVSEELKAKFNPKLTDTIDYKLPLLSFDPRDYQEECVRKCLQQARGTSIIPTAAGKSFIQCLLIQTIKQQVNDKFKFFIIVPTLQLIDQLFEDFIDYGVDENTMCKWSGDYEPNFNKQIIIAGSNILYSKNTKLDFVDKIDVLLIDECHKVSKDSEISDIIKKFPTLYKFGFSGTLPNKLIDQWNVYGKIGPLIYQENSQTLQGDNILAPVLVYILKMLYKDILNFEISNNPLENFKEEYNFLINNKFRNDTICKLASKLDNNTLIMVDRIEHGELLYNNIKQLIPNKQIFFIHGEIEVNERTRITKLIETSNDCVVIAVSSIFSTGINIKNLHYIIFVCGGKSKVRLIQSIGRGRRMHLTKNSLVLFDIADDLIYGYKHLRQRIKVYEAEGFTYQIKEYQEV